MSNQNIKDWKDYRPIGKPNAPAFSQVLLDPKNTGQRRVFLEAFFIWLNPEFKKWSYKKPAGEVYDRLVAKKEIEACKEFHMDGALPTARQLCFVTDMLIWNEFFVQFMGANPSTVPCWPWLDDVPPPDIKSEGVSPVFTMWRQGHEAKVAAEKLAAEKVAAEKLATERAAAEKMAKDEETKKERDNVLHGKAKAPSGWVDYRPAGRPDAPPFGEVLRDPTSMSERRAFMASYFQWLSPEFEMAAYFELALHLQPQAIEYFYSIDARPTQRQLCFATDMMIWHRFFEKYLGVTLDAIPAWPWPQHVPPPNVEEEGVSETFLEYVHDNLSKEMCQLSVGQQTTAGPSGADKKPNRGILASRFAPKTGEQKEGQGVTVKVAAGRATESKVMPGSQCKAPAGPVVKAKREASQSWAEESSPAAIAPVAEAPVAMVQDEKVQAEWYRERTEINLWRKTVAEFNLADALVAYKFSSAFTLQLPAELNDDKFIRDSIMDKASSSTHKWVMTMITTPPGASALAVRVRLNGTKLWVDDTRLASDELRRHWHGIIAWVTEARCKRPVPFDQFCKGSVYAKALNATTEEAQQLYVALINSWE